MANFAEKLNLQLRGEISEKLNRLPLSYFDRQQPGAIMSRATNDLEKMSEALQTGLLRLFMAVGTILGSLSIMAYFDGFLTAVFLFFTAISLLAAKAASQKTLRYAARRQDCTGKLNSLIEEAYSGRMLIKAFNREEESLARSARPLWSWQTLPKKQIGSSMPLTPESALSTGSDRLLWLFREVLCS